MHPKQQRTIYQVQLKNDVMLKALFDAKVNERVTLGIHDDDQVSGGVNGRVCYRSENMIHVNLVMYYVMVDIKTKMAYFMDIFDTKESWYHVHPATPVGGKTSLYSSSEPW